MNKRTDLRENPEGIIEMYSQGYSMADVANNYNCSSPTIKSILKNNGVKIRPRYVKANRDRKISLPEDEIIHLYLDKGLSMTKISDKYNCSYKPIKRVLKENNIKIRDSNYLKGTKSPKRINLPEKEVIEMYNNNDSPMTKISKHFDCDYCVVKRILKENNIKIKPAKYYLEGKESCNKLEMPEEKIINLYLKEEKSISEIKKKFDCSHDVIERILKENDIDIRPLSFYTKGTKSPQKGKTFEEFYGEERAKEIKKKISESTEEIMTPEHRERLSEIRKEGIEEGRIEVWGHGIPASGENHPCWRGGISFEPYGKEFNKELKEKIRKRDNYECQECGKSSSQIHHIDYDKTNNSELNLITLCRSCHAKTNYDREHWTKYFKMKIFIKELFNPQNILTFNENKQLTNITRIH